MAHRLSLELRNAEDRIKELEADVSVSKAARHALSNGWGR
jgi:hypothetical protein